MWTAKFWKDAAERAVKSAAQGLVLYLTGGQVFDAWRTNWAAAGSIAGSAALLSLLSSIISSFVGNSTSASLVTK